MRTATIKNDLKLGLRAETDGFFAALGPGFNVYLERLTRADEVRRLQAKSDAKLAKMGLARAEIVRRVFRDLFYL